MRRMCLVTAVLAAVWALAGCDWVAFGFNVENVTYNPSEPRLTTSTVGHLSVAWSAPCVCGTFEPANRPLVAGGLVYALNGYTTAPYSLSLRALDASSGQLRWSTPLGTSDFGDYLAGVANGLVYVAVPTGAARVVAVDATSGKLRWQMTPPAPGSGAVSLSVPVVDGPLAFVAASANGGSEISAIDAGGGVAWSATPGGDVVSESLTADPGRTLYVVSRLRFTAPPGGSITLLTGYAERDGTVQSSVSVQVDNVTDVVFAGFSNGLVYGAQSPTHGLDGVAFAVHPDTGALAWSTGRPSGTGDYVVESAITPTVVLINHPYGVTARDPTSGAVRWQVTDSTAEAVAGDLVIFWQGNIRRLSDGTLVATAPGIGEQPVERTPAAGHIYTSTSSHVYALAP